MVYYLGPLAPNIWYEMHIQAQGAVARVFMRERDAENKAKRAWATVIPNPADPEDPYVGCYFPGSVLQDLSYFVLWVQHNQENTQQNGTVKDEREWSFDDISLVKSTESQTPCTGASPCE